MIRFDKETSHRLGSFKDTFWVRFCRKGWLIMTFREYIGTIKETGRLIGSREKIVIELFEAAGTKEEIKETTVKSWIRDKENKGYRKCAIRDYFKEDKICEDGLIGFFENYINTSWKRLQKAFKANNDNDDDFVVNLDTDNEKVFYWSLVRQFQKIHRLPLTELPHDVMKLAKSEQMLKAFGQLHHENRISYFIDQNLSEGLNSDLLSLVDHFIETIELTVNEIGPCDNREIILQYSETLSQYRNYMEKNILALQNTFHKLFGIPALGGVLCGWLPGSVLPDAFAKSKTDEYIRYRQQLKFLYSKITGNDSE